MQCSRHSSSVECYLDSSCNYYCDVGSYGLDCAHGNFLFQLQTSMCFSFTSSYECLQCYLCLTNCVNSTAVCQHEINQSVKEMTVRLTFLATRMWILLMDQRSGSKDELRKHNCRTIFLFAIGFDNFLIGLTSLEILSWVNM